MHDSSAKVLRELYRHLPELEALASKTGQHIFSGRYLQDGQAVAISVSLYDLQGKLETLSARKREAIYLNIIEDQKQDDVAKVMGISAQTVGQYVDAGMTKIAIELGLAND